MPSSILKSVRRVASKVAEGVRKETHVLRTTGNDVDATLARLARRDPGLPEFLRRRAYAYAVFPSVGKAGAVLGGAFGKGEVFRGQRLVGYAAVAQLTIGVQLGGQTFTEIACFENKPAFDRFKHGKLAFAASASAVLIKAGAAASSDFDRGVAVFVYADGGMELEAAIGGQKLFFRSAFLGRFTRAPRVGVSRPTTPARSKKRKDRHERTSRNRSQKRLETPRRRAPTSSARSKNP